jgi:hypothetical protein
MKKYLLFKWVQYSSLEGEEHSSPCFVTRKAFNKNDVNENMKLFKMNSNNKELTITKVLENPLTIKEAKEFY